jgi:transcription elongation factor Elf1
MCGIEPSNLAGELPGLKIGLDSVNWYQQEIDRYSELSSRYSEDAAQFESNEAEENGQNRNTENLELLVRYTEPFLQD